MLRDCVLPRGCGLVLCHSRTTRIARFHVRLETDGWHRSGLAWRLACRGASWLLRGAAGICQSALPRAVTAILR